MVGDELALFSKSASTLVLISSGGAVRELGRRFDAPLFTPPHAADGYMTFYPKSFDAMIHLTDLDGNESPGWPAQASGISFCAPRLVQDGQSTLVSFLTQAGALHVWSLSGSQMPGFPVTLPGVFYATPEPMDVNGSPVLVAVAQDGSLSMIAMSGTVTRQTQVPDLDGKSARVFLGDIDHDGTPEILLYGAGAFISGYDASFRPLSGFPLKGMTRPQLVDLDGNGRVDFLTAGLDGRIYAYTMARGRR
jgi:hypothetical protein